MADVFAMCLSGRCLTTDESFLADVIAMWQME